MRNFEETVEKPVHPKKTDFEGREEDYKIAKREYAKNYARYRKFIKEQDQEPEKEPEPKPKEMAEKMVQEEKPKEEKKQSSIFDEIDSEFEKYQAKEQEQEQQFHREKSREVQRIEPAYEEPEPEINSKKYDISGKMLLNFIDIFFPKAILFLYGYINKKAKLIDPESIKLKATEKRDFEEAADEVAKEMLSEVNPAIFLVLGISVTYVDNLQREIKKIK